MDRIVPPIPEADDDIFYPVKEERCEARRRGYHCTRKQNHYGRHIGGYRNGDGKVTYDPVNGTWKKGESVDGR